MGEILQYEPVPGSDEFVDVLKTQATLATSIVSAAIRQRDGSLAKQVDDKLNLILEELRAKELEFGVHLLPAEAPADAPPHSLDQTSGPVPVFARRN